MMAGRLVHANNQIPVHLSGEINVERVYVRLSPAQSDSPATRSIISQIISEAVPALGPKVNDMSYRVLFPQ